ncbi:ABC transporter permease [Burkholderia sp. TSV86]|uniref:ABC transporter permease n=1 Tax=Burkholderia sp. TSV86 TaxID=1385594 RepID=UPI000756C421|nr:ABC transporter permease [Burkholderia sp. TSV86]KVE35384.1 sugar ABC transporter permease [Burkholderia sp. TSV86]
MATHDTPLPRSIAIQTRVVGALLMREILTRFGRHNIGFLWMFFEPMMFTVGVLTLWTVTKMTHGSSLPVTAFAVTGYSPVLLWRNCANRCALAILPNQALLYHRNVRVLDFFFARLLLEIGGATMSFTFLTILFITVGMMKPPEDVLLVLGGWLHFIVFGSSLALIIGALSERSEAIERVWHTVSYLLFPLSGSVFMVSWIPQKFQPYVLLLPMVHGSEMLRAGYFGSLVTPHYSVQYMVFSNAILLLIGLYLVRDTGRRVEPE